MRDTNKKIILIIMFMGLIFSNGCNSRSSDINGNISNDELERLPEDQRESELDKQLAEKRKFRKEGYKVESGSMTSISETDSDLSGQTSNRPDFSKDGEEIFKIAENYIKNELKIPPTDKYGYDIAFSIDPRINVIYDDENKGVAKGYENENIRIMEYEEKENIYKYLILVRETKDSMWKIIHNGTSYKKE